MDDHDGFREVLRQLLSGYEEVEVIAEARDGEEAIIQVASYQPDVILMDLRMPRMDGVRATTVIKKGRLHTPIIGLCLLHDTYTIEAFLKAGGLAVVSKDRIEDIQATIRRACLQRLT